MADIERFERQPLLRHPVVVGLSLLLLAATIVALATVRELVLVCVLAILVAVVLSFPIGLLSRVMPRGLATLLVLVVLLASIVGALRFALPAIRDQLAEVVDRLPMAIDQIDSWLRWIQRQAPLGDRAGAGPAKDWITEGFRKGASKAVPALFGIASGFTFAVLVLALGFFLALEPDAYRRGLRRLAPREQESVVDEGWARIGGALRGWLGGILVAMTIMGLITAFGLWAVGIDAWLVLGALTFVGTFVPYAGAIASAIPGVLLALTQSPRHGLLALAVYVGVHIVEGYIVEPLIMKRAVRIRPALLLGWQLVFGGIFGPLGVVVATPVLACVQAAVEYFWVERRLGKPAW